MTLSDLRRLADEDLMPLVAAKDPLAFEVFYDRHGGAAFSLAYRIVGNRKGLHAGRRVVHGSTVGEPVLLGIWSETATGSCVRLTGTSISCFTRLNRDEFLERDVFVGSGQRIAMFGRGRRIAIAADTDHSQLAYRPGERAVELSGPPPIYRGEGAHADWRIGFLRPLTK